MIAIFILFIFHIYTSKTSSICHRNKILYTYIYGMFIFDVVTCIFILVVKSADPFSLAYGIILLIDVVAVNMVAVDIICLPDNSAL